MWRSWPSCEKWPGGHRAIPRARPDVMFLDVQMPEIDGFELLSRLGTEHPIRVVFVTAYSEHAVRALRGGSARLSPQTVRPRAVRPSIRAGAGPPAPRPRRLQPASRRLSGFGRPTFRGVREIRSPGHTPPAATDDDRGRWAHVPGQGRRHRLDRSGRQLRAHHTGKVVHLLRQTLATLEASLDPDHFARIHRGRW